MSDASPQKPLRVSRVEQDKGGAPKNVGGRPPKITPDVGTLKTIAGLGQIQCTTRECAAVLHVHEDTFLAFLKAHPEARAAYEDGKGTGCMSLRRRQFNLAEKNAAMAIFLGKNYLGQTDKQEFEHSGNFTVNLNGADADL